MASANRVYRAEGPARPRAPAARAHEIRRPGAPRGRRGARGGRAGRAPTPAKARPALPGHERRVSGRPVVPRLRRHPRRAVHAAVHLRAGSAGWSAHILEQKSGRARLIRPDRQVRRPRRRARSAELLDAHPRRRLALKRATYSAHSFCPRCARWRAGCLAAPVAGRADDGAAGREGRNAAAGRSWARAPGWPAGSRTVSTSGPPKCPAQRPGRARRRPAPPRRRRDPRGGDRLEAHAHRDPDDRQARRPWTSHSSSSSWNCVARRIVWGHEGGLDDALAGQLAPVVAERQVVDADDRHVEQVAARRPPAGDQVCASAPRRPLPCLAPVPRRGVDDDPRRRRPPRPRPSPVSRSPDVGAGAGRRRDRTRTSWPALAQQGDQRPAEGRRVPPVTRTMLQEPGWALRNRSRQAGPAPRR